MLDKPSHIWRKFKHIWNKSSPIYEKSSPIYVSCVKYQVSGVRCQVDQVVKLVSWGSVLTGLPCLVLLSYTKIKTLVGSWAHKDHLLKQKGPWLSPDAVLHPRTTENLPHLADTTPQHYTTTHKTKHTAAHYTTLYYATLHFIIYTTLSYT